MKITASTEHTTVTIEEPDDLTAHDFLDLCRRVAIALTYQQGSWEAAVDEDAYQRSLFMNHEQDAEDDPSTPF